MRFALFEEIEGKFGAVSPYLCYKVLEGFGPELVK